MRGKHKGIVIAAALAVLVPATRCGGDEAAPSAEETRSPESTTSTSTSPIPQSSTADPNEFGPVTLSPLTGESTKLTIGGHFLEALSALRVDLQPVGGADVQTTGGVTSFTFPVTTGEVTVEATGIERLEGTVRHQGGLRLSALGRSATVDDLVIDAGLNRLTAQVGERCVTLLPVDASDADIIRSDGRVVITDDAVALAPEAATALAELLGLRALPEVDLGQLQITFTGS